MVDSQRLAYGLAGAVLVELVLAGRVAVADDGRRGGSRVGVMTTAPLGDQLLDPALQRIAGLRQPVAAQRAVTTLAKGLTGALRDGLVGRGVLRVEEGRTLGIFPHHAWPAVDSAHEAGVRAALWDVVVIGRTPTDREVSLVSLLQAMGQVPKVLAADGMSARQLQDRAKAISEGNVGGDAVRRAIQAANDAVMAAIIATTVASVATT